MRGIGVGIEEPEFRFRLKNLTDAQITAITPLDGEITWASEANGGAGAFIIGTGGSWVDGSGNPYPGE